MKYLLLLAFILNISTITAQNIEIDSVTSQSNSNINYSNRQNLVKWTGIGAYTVGSISLYNFWYKDFEQEGFHFFNDLKEWHGVDKMGHVHASYLQSHLLFKGFKWSGYSEDKSILLGSITGLTFQTTIEIMDGFSSGWGFSIPDYVANVLGVSLFAFQQKLWHEQKISIKMSYWPQTYSNNVISFDQTFENRADQLFGQSFPEKFLKDYNAQTYWLSFNPSLLFPKINTPTWLNLSLGYSAKNMYGGFGNSWEIDNQKYTIDEAIYPRHQQFIIALDYDLSKIRTNSRFLKSMLDILNVFKWPAPGVEFTTTGEVKFHLLFLN